MTSSSTGLSNFIQQISSAQGNTSSMLNMLGLGDLSTFLSSEQAQNLIGGVMGGDSSNINIQMITELLPTLLSLSDTVKNKLFSSKGIKFFEFLSSIYSNNQINPDNLSKLFTDPKFKEKLDIVRAQYNLGGGMQGVNENDLIELISHMDINIDLSKNLQYINAIKEIVHNRKLTNEMARKLLKLINPQ